MYSEYKEINGTNGYKLNNFTVFDVPNKGIPFNLFDEIGDFLDKGIKIPNFDNNRNIIDDIYLDYILVEYNNKNIRDNDIEKINLKFNKIKPLSSEVIDGNRQVAEPVGNFELNGKYYLVLNPYNAITDETSPEKGVYKGVIVNPDLYFGEVENEVEDVKGKFKNLKII